MGSKTKAFVALFSILIFLVNSLCGCSFSTKESGLFSAFDESKDHKAGFKAGWEAAEKQLGIEIAAPDRTEFFESVKAAIDEFGLDINKSLHSDRGIEQEKGLIEGRWDTGVDNTNTTIQNGDIYAEASKVYYLSTDKSAIEQAQTILGAYGEYRRRLLADGKAPLGFPEYVDENGYGGNISKIATSYIGQMRTIPSDQIDHAIDYVTGEVNSCALLEETEIWDVLKKLRNRIESPNSLAIEPISSEELLVLTEMASTGKFNPETYGFSIAGILTPKYVIKEALSEVVRTELVEGVICIAPDLFSIIRESVRTGEIDIDALKSAGIDGLFKDNEEYLKGAIARLVVYECRSGKLGEAFTDVSTDEVAAIVELIVQSARYGYALYNEEISVSEYGDLIAENVVVACSIVGGETFKHLLPLLPYAYQIGSMVGTMIGEVGIDILKYAADKIIMRMEGAGGFEVILPTEKIINGIDDLPISEWIKNLHIANRLSSAADLTVSLFKDGEICIGVDADYFCTSCGSTLNEQEEFDPDLGYWRCKECGEALYDGENVYSGELFKDILWFCDDCGAFLNKQMGFTDTKGTWTCLDCGYVNEISESMIER